MEPIYLDANATTPLLPQALDAMRPFLCEAFGNPASAHRFGRRARAALEDARERVAACLGAHPDEVVFTSGATEANNLALFGLADSPPARLSATPVEHPSVTEPLRRLEQVGFALSWLPVDAAGVVSAEVPPDTRLAAVQLANHETGTVQPVAALAGGVSVHCDAAQAAGRLPVDFHALAAATLSVSAHKFHGPKGVGALLVRRGVRLAPLLHGGHQQHGRRPGTEPVALAVGMAVALDAARQSLAARLAHVRRCRHILLDHLRQHAAPLVLNGASETGVPHTLNLSFPGVRADALLMALDLAGVACSAGSACSSGSLLPSPVLRAMNAPDHVLGSAVRLSLHPLLTEADVEQAARRISNTVRRLRQQPDDAS